MIHRTVWTLLFAMLLQLLASSAWAWRMPTAAAPVMHCHDMAATDMQHADAQQMASDQNAGAHHNHPPVGHHADSHHCCAVGIGTGTSTQLLPLPQAVPHSQHGPWASLSLRPDLRPPI